MSPESDRDDSHGHFMGEKGDILNKHCEKWKEGAML